MVGRANIEPRDSIALLTPHGLASTQHEESYPARLKRLNVEVLVRPWNDSCEQSVAPFIEENLCFDHLTLIRIGVDTGP